MHLFRLSPNQQLFEKRMHTAELENHLNSMMSARMQEARNRLALYVERLEGSSPLRRLREGFSYVTDEDGNCICQVDQVKGGERITVHVADGTYRAIVE